MNIIDVKVINEKCEVLVEKDGEQIKYTLNLNNPKLLKYLNSFLNKKNKELEEAKIDMESDYFGKSLRDGFLCYGLASVLSFFLLAKTLYASELIGMLGTVGTFAILGVSHFIKTAIVYDVDPEKEKKVDEITKEIESVKNTKKIVLKKVNEKRENDEKKRREEEDRRKYEERKKMQEDIRKHQEEMRKQTIRSSRLMPNELSILDEIVKLAHVSDEYRGIPYMEIRDILRKKFLEIKRQDPERRNTEILREMMTEFKPFEINRRR